MKSFIINGLCQVGGYEVSCKTALIIIIPYFNFKVPIPYKLYRITHTAQSVEEKPVSVNLVRPKPHFQFQDFYFLR